MRKLFLFAAAAAVLALGGCDSGDPDDNPDPSDVDGTYEFTQYVFEPSGSGFQPIQVLDTLDTEETELRLFADGEFFLIYQFVAGDQYLVTGEFDVSTGAVTLSVGDEDQADVERILLSDEFTLRRDPDGSDVLSAEVTKTINPSAFSDRYEGVESMAGTLRIRLDQR